ncbi:conserved hypothetical protein [Leptothrix cholodnii SP-6]|uniref:Lipoprotein n=1 Tax=Leptothrix cholodnii (strain ATCC 51168 / LMG 8142 / SP-6) TaxID=395495 RepID=B1Y2G4_LEPCP|nr:hypothetical protein [Leptothrix cholodnii]ACB33180.1 conserved hypothetical protein [Leptothrix cholodnii SP-6]
MRRIAHTLALTLLTALVGCAAGNIPPDFSFGDKPAVGVIVASVAQNESANPGARTQIYFDTHGRPGMNRLQSSGESLDEATEPLPRLAGGGQLVVLKVPAGRHTLDAWQMRDGVGGWVQPAGVLKPLAFTVVAGEVRYIGSLEGTLAMRKNALGLRVVDSAAVEIKDQRARDIAAFEAAYPQFKGQVVIDLLPTGPWAAAEGLEFADGPGAPVLPAARR